VAKVRTAGVKRGRVSGLTDFAAAAAATSFPFQKRRRSVDSGTEGDDDLPGPSGGRRGETGGVRGGDIVIRGVGGERQQSAEARRYLASFRDTGQFGNFIVRRPTTLQLNRRLHESLRFADVVRAMRAAFVASHASGRRGAYYTVSLGALLRRSLGPAGDVVLRHFFAGGHGQRGIMLNFWERLHLVTDMASLERLIDEMRGSFQRIIDDAIVEFPESGWQILMFTNVLVTVHYL